MALVRSIREPSLERVEVVEVGLGHHYLALTVTRSPWRFVVFHLLTCSLFACF